MFVVFLEVDTSTGTCPQVPVLIVAEFRDLFWVPVESLVREVRRRGGRYAVRIRSAGGTHVEEKDRECRAWDAGICIAKLAMELDNLTFRAAKAKFAGWSW